MLLMSPYVLCSLVAMVAFLVISENVLHSIAISTQPQAEMPVAGNSNPTDRDAHTPWSRSVAGKASYGKLWKSTCQLESATGTDTPE